MRRFALPFIAVAIALVAARPAAAQEAAGEDATTITATVIDLSCSIVSDQGGEQHRMCAQKCADMGQPLALMTSDGQILMPVNTGMGAPGENERLKEFAEQEVTVTGKVIDRGGVKAIVIDNVTKA